MDLQTSNKIGTPKKDDETLFSLLYEILDNQNDLLHENNQLNEKLKDAEARIKKLEKELGGAYSK